jgi:hypothetical protein
VAAKIKGGLFAAVLAGVVIEWLMGSHAIELLLAWHLTPLHH